MNPTGFGICRQAIIPVRVAPQHTSELVSQLLFGDSYEVHEASPHKHWLFIRVTGDQIEGWIDLRQHHAITPEYLDQINQADYKITTDVTSVILYKKSPLTIVMGSIVPISSSDLFKTDEQFAFNGEAKSLSQRRDFEFLKFVASRYINAPYCWGGKSPFGIDAGGLVQMVFRIAGYSVLRHPDQQSASGKKVKSIGDALPGDLALFADAKGRITHSGIVLEDEKIIHAWGRVRIDHLHEEGIMDVDTKILSHQLFGLRRVMGAPR
jgi:gamma-D-glutamyl-L-lysine dipeptidyl-peptidase